jgi:hypothetical protein
MMKHIPRSKTGRVLLQGAVAVAVIFGAAT